MLHVADPSQHLKCLAQKKQEIWNLLSGFDECFALKLLSGRKVPPWHTILQLPVYAGLIKPSCGRELLDGIHENTKHRTQVTLRHPSGYEANDMLERLSIHETLKK